ncbi:MAG TPA: MarR family transcriptional regulator [Aggregatilineales bacterium]|nr:MarR family transcriptional regulator [Anaerolineales bacterium]HRE46423.1 MarR family transcriptional regulator [Aggregatilineales bacterium]
MTEEELRAIALDVRLLMVISLKMMGRDMDSRLEEYRVPVSGLGIGVIGMLEHYQHCAVNEISRNMLLTSATLIPVLDGLAKNGYISRERDPQDRRRVLVSLTDKGRKLIRIVHDMYTNNALVKTIQAMGGEKCRIFISLLDEFSQHMSEHSDSGEFYHNFQQNHPLKTRLEADKPTTENTGE